MNRAVLSALVSSLIPLAVGCGNPPGKPDQPDATVAGAPDAAVAGNSDAADGPVKVTGFSPADGAKRVGPHTKITIQLSGAAEPASISASTVKVFFAGTKYPMAGAVSYDATAHTITFTPSVPMSTSSKFEVDVKGVMAKGVAIADASATFSTLANPAKSEIAFATDTKPDFYINWTVDADGNYLQRVQKSAGPDRLIGTADDFEQEWVAWKYSAGHTQRWFYTDPGADKIWGNGDDVVTSYTDEVRGPIGVKQFITYKGAGVDGTWGTDDDVATDYRLYTFDELARVTRSVVAAAGPDGKVGSEDDIVYLYTDTSYPDGGTTPTGAITYGKAGGDLEWFTPDDEIDLFEVDHADATGKVPTIEYFAPGDDGKPGTADDFQIGVDVWTFNAAGDTIATDSTANTGADDKWGTDDDIKWGYSKTTVDDAGLSVSEDDFSPGTDQIGNNADDYKSRAWTYDTTH